MQELHSTGNSVTTPSGVMRPIVAGRLGELSVNQMLPSEPRVMALGSLLAVGTLYCFRLPTGAACKFGTSQMKSSALVAPLSGFKIDRNTARPSMLVLCLGENIVTPPDDVV